MIIFNNNYDDEQFMKSCSDENLLLILLVSVPPLAIARNDDDSSHHNEFINCTHCQLEFSSFQVSKNSLCTFCIIFCCLIVAVDFRRMRNEAVNVGGVCCE